MHVLLNTAYFPPVSYFASMAAGMELPLSGQSAVAPAVVYVEACGNYMKQSYRNRCHFFSECGLQSLSFPVVHSGGTHQHPDTEILVDYSTQWVRQHERAIVSAYKTSAFFEYYQDELFAILESRPPTLFGLNMAITAFFLEKTGIRAEIRLTDTFRKPDSFVAGGCWDALPYISDADLCDLREVIHPKRPNDILRRLGTEKPYYQVFALKYGFIQDLSIMDLLFNEGPDSISYLKNISTQKSLRSGSRA